MSHCCQQLTGLSEDAPVTEAATALGRGGLLDVEHPLIDTYPTMPPHRVVEAGHPEPGARPTQALSTQYRLEQVEVAGIGQGRGIEHRIIAELGTGTEPHMLLLSLPIIGGGEVQGRLDRADLEGTFIQPFGHLRGVLPSQDVAQLWAILWTRQPGGHGLCVFETLLLNLEGGDQGQDRDVLLIGVDASSGERSPVAQSFDTELNRLADIPSAQEVAVK